MTVTSWCICSFITHITCMSWLEDKRRPTSPACLGRKIGVIVRFMDVCGDSVPKCKLCPVCSSMNHLVGHHWSRQGHGQGLVSLVSWSPRTATILCSGYREGRFETNNLHLTVPPTRLVCRKAHCCWNGTCGSERRCYIRLLSQCAGLTDYCLHNTTHSVIWTTSCLNGGSLRRNHETNQVI